MRSRTIIASSLVACVAVAVGLCPVSAAATAQDSQPVSDSNLTVEQARAAFTSTGFQVDQPLNWAWTSSPVTTFQIHDPARARVVMVLVYPNAPAAKTERLQAQAHEQLLTPGLVAAEPHLVPGYGPSIWRGNLAMVQTEPVRAGPHLPAAKRPRQLHRHRHRSRARATELPSRS
jgi:hypothetical protein